MSLYELIKEVWTIAKKFLELAKNIRGIPNLLFLLATESVQRKAAVDLGVRLTTGRYGCLHINKPSNTTVSVQIQCVFPYFGCLNRFLNGLLLF